MLVFPLLYIKKNWIEESTTFIVDAHFSFTIIYKENESGDRKSKNFQQDYLIAFREYAKRIPS